MSATHASPPSQPPAARPADAGPRRGRRATTVPERAGAGPRHGAHMAGPARTQQARRARLAGARAGAGAVRRAEHRAALPERLRQRLLRRRREVDARLLPRLPVRLLRPRRPDHHRQAPARAVGAGGKRQAVRLLPPQPAAARGVIGVLAVAALYGALRRPLGLLPALAGALALAVFPSSWRSPATTASTPC